MALPLTPPIPPQLAKPARALPEGADWAYEPKWDGFRAIIFVDGSSRFVQSRNGRPLDRYFPELLFAAGRYVLDGEIVVGAPGEPPDFEALQQRIHPAASRVQRLAEELPARYVAFDLLAEDDRSLMEEPFADRRAALERLLARSPSSTVSLTEQVGTPAEAERWLRSSEGVVAKRLDAPYRPGERVGMSKIRRVRTMDCVVAGYRTGKLAGTVGSLMLGLYDADGRLDIVGHTSGFSAREKRELLDRLTPYETGERGSAEPSRWAADRELQWIALRPELVVEVSFDHVSGGRVRHGTRIERWRDDKPPAACTRDQLDA